MQDKKYLQFSGIPVICRICGVQLRKNAYRKGKDGSYLCKSCYNKFSR